MDECPARGQNCNYCGKSDHFPKVCLKRARERINIIHESDSNGATDYNDTNDGSVFKITDREYLLSQSSGTSQNEIFAVLTPLSSNKCFSSFTVCIFPDSGATLCIAGPMHQKAMNISDRDLKRTNKPVTVAGGGTLLCYGHICVQFDVFDRTTVQEVYFCRDVKRFYFSKVACISIGILNPLFPQTMIKAIHTSSSTDEPPKLPTTKIPNKPVNHFNLSPVPSDNTTSTVCHSYHPSLSQEVAICPNP